MEYDDYNEYGDPYELDELDKDLSFLFALMEVLDSIKKAWDSLKQSILSKAPLLKEDVDKFDDLINYFY